MFKRITITFGSVTAAAVLVASGGPPRREAEAPELEGAYPLTVRAKGVVREHRIRAAPATVTLFDGKRIEVWAYNDQVPGPTLRLKRGETLKVRFQNDLPQPTTIHWHGVRVPHAMDGVPGVSQPPVPPGGDFVYEFTPKDPGTYWFHPHLRASEQVERGLFGVLIVEDERPAPFSRELVWVVDDWLMAGDKIDPQFNTRRDLAHDGRWGNVVTVNGQRAPAFDVRPGERVRLRLLNVANGRVFIPDFGELEARIIAVDGLYTARPLDPKGFEMAPGNRLDLDVTIPATAAGRRLPVTDRYMRAPIRLAELAVAQGKPVKTPSFESPARAHVPAWPDAAQRPVRAEFQLDARPGGEFGIEWTINGRASAHHNHTADTDAAVLPWGQWSKLRFTNRSFRIHPMHIHGTFFKLLARNGRPADEPFFRDTVLVHRQETVDIGLVPVDKGRWMMHCHILEHAEAGMMGLLRVE